MLDRFSTGLQSIINTLVGARGTKRHPLKSLLNGSWLGHPLHPVITDIAIGGLVLAAIGDIAWLAFPITQPWAPRMAEVTLIVGVVGMLGSALTGLADWSDTYGAERSTGLLHGLLNTLALLLAVVAVILHLHIATGRSVPAAIFTFLSVGVMSAAAFFGGDLVFRFGTNVNHTAWEHGEEAFETIGPLANIPDNQLTRVMVGGVPVVVLRMGEKISALAATCTHAGGPLDEGTISPNGVVRCPWHGSRFRMYTGKVLDGPATIPQPVYDVQIQDGNVALKRR